jgi:hypothetical protein
MAQVRLPPKFFGRLISKDLGLRVAGVLKTAAHHVPQSRQAVPRSAIHAMRGISWYGLDIGERQGRSRYPIDWASCRTSSSSGRSTVLAVASCAGLKSTLINRRRSMARQSAGEPGRSPRGTDQVWCALSVQHTTPACDAKRDSPCCPCAG